MRTGMGLKGRGFTLLELLVASILALVVMGTTLSLLLAGIAVNGRNLTQGTVQEEARRAVEAITRELKDSSPSCTGWVIGVDPPSPEAFYDTAVTQISFSRCTGYDTVLDMLEWGPVVTLGYEPAQGAEPGKIFRMENGFKTYICDSVSDFNVTYLSATGEFEVTVAVSRTDPGNPDQTISAAHTALVKLRN